MKRTKNISCFILVFVLQINFCFGYSSFLIFRSEISGLGGEQFEIVKNLPPPANKFAFLIGVETYINLAAQEQLTAPENDVALMKDLLVKNYGFTDAPSRIKTLLSAEATKNNIVTTFESFLIKNAEINKDSIVVFYFSGHGSQEKDLNNDEGDGWDETIVPTDSRKNGITDILDDDISEWFEKLRQKTPNVTFILDSCHSGSNTKSLDAGLKAKELLPDTQAQPKQKSLPKNFKESGSKDLGNGILSRNESYVSISACLPDEKAQEGWFNTVEGERRYSVLTHYLVQSLKRKSDLTYRKLGEVLLNEIDRSLRQQTQVEGDIGRKVFGGAVTREDPFIPLLEASSGKILKLRAGAAQGLQEGTLVAAYKPETQKLVGETGKISNALITKVNDFDAVAEMPADVAVPVNAKISVITPNFGNKRLRIALDPTGVVAATDEGKVVQSNQAPEIKFVKDVASLMKDDKFSKLVEVVPLSGAGETLPRGTWDVVLVRGIFRNIKEHLVLSSAPTISDSQVVYYLASRDSNQPLFNFYVTSNDATGIDRMTSAIGKKARQDNLRRLSNASSPLNESLKVTLIRTTVETAANGTRIVKDAIRTEDQTGTPIFKLNDLFKLKFENLSDKEIYITLLSLGTSGGIDIISEGGRGIKLAARGNFTEGAQEPFKSFPPKGMEAIKIIITTSPTDFRFLMQSGTKDLIEYSPFDVLLDRANTGRSKDLGKESGLKLDSWGAALINLEIK